MFHPKRNGYIIVKHSFLYLLSIKEQVPVDGTRIKTKYSNDTM